MRICCILPYDKYFKYIFDVYKEMKQKLSIIRKKVVSLFQDF